MGAVTPSTQLGANRRTEAEVIAEIAQKATAPSRLEGVNVPFVVRDVGQIVEPLTNLLENPLKDPGRIRANVDFVCAESFVAYVKRFRLDDRTHLFADETKGVVTAYLDYHGPDKPSRVTHTARLTLIQSREWKTWFGNNKQLRSQINFAEFLEDNLLDIIDPDHATILEAVKHLEAKKNVAFTSGINLRDGSIQFKFEEEVESKGKGDIVLPDGFIIRIAPFDRCPPVAIPVKLRFRINDQKLSFQYVMQQPEKIVDAAFASVLDLVEKELETTPLYGAVTLK